MLNLRLSAVVTVALVAWFSVACEKEEDAETDNDAPALDATPPVVKHLGFEFGTTVQGGMLGAFKVDRVFWEPETPKAFLEFGGTLVNHLGSHKLGHLLYTIPEGTPIYAMFDGVVTTIDPQEDNGVVVDYEVHLRPAADSDWYINYDHVKNVAVAIGDTVTAGTKIAEGTDYMTEVDIGRNTENTTFCPYALAGEAEKAQLYQNVVDFMTAWEQARGDPSIYDETMAVPGCITSEFTFE